jgi:hypothetical protein
MLEVDVCTKAKLDAREALKGLVKCGASGTAVRHDVRKKAAKD